MPSLTENPGRTVVAAVIGLGSMGLGMARSMKRAGLDVVGYDISPTAIDHFIAAGGRGAATPANAAKNADIVVSVVVNSAQTAAVLFGPHGVAETMKSKAVFISSATMDPAVARDLSQRAEALGFHYLDAPISGGAAKAESGELTIMASGSKQAFDTARPALDAMASKVYELGDAAGTGAAFKMINQLLAGVHIAAACEAITFAAKQGLDLDKVYEVITASAGNSWMFENRVRHVLAGDYTRSARSRFSSRILASSRIWPVRSAIRYRSSRRPCRCIWPLRARAWAATTIPLSHGFMPSFRVRNCQA